MAAMIDDLTPPPESAITAEDWQQTPFRVQVRVGELCVEVKQLRETVEQLQEIANRNSQNSSQPPSQDRPDQRPVKEPSGPPRKRGGQPGHRGHHRVLVDEVDEVVVYKPTSCKGCETLLVACWLLLTWGAIAAIANAAVIDRLEHYRTRT
jgi:transposase